MFGKRDNDTAHAEKSRTTTTRAPVADAPHARGGIAFGPVLTGVVVAFGSMFLLSALIAGVLASLGLIDANVTAGDVIEAGIGAGVALVIAQFLSYLWGGYTAGRMARGAGIGNGLLVPLVAILTAILVGGIAAALGANANLNLPFTTNQLPTENGNLVDWGIGVGIASLIAMFLGGALGGAMGSRWHTKLENRTHEEAVARREVDLRDHDRTRSETRTPVAAGARTGGAAATSGTAGYGSAGDRSTGVERPVDLSSESSGEETRTYRR